MSQKRLYHPGGQARVALIFRNVTGTLLDSVPEALDKVNDNFDDLYSIRYDDLRFPAQGVNPIGAASDPTVVTSLSDMTGALSFSGSIENIIAGTAQLPHSWQRGTDLYPHIHWCRAVTTTASPLTAIDWRMYYRIVGNPGDLAGSWSSAQVPTQHIGDDGVAYTHILTVFPSIDMSAHKESAIVQWRIHRLGNTDASANAALLYEFDIHFAIDKRGTTTIIPA